MFWPRNIHPCQLLQKRSHETTYSWEDKTKISAIHQNWIRSLTFPKYAKIVPHVIFSKYMLETLGSSGEKFAPMFFVCLFVFNLQTNTNLAKLLCPCSSAGSVQSQLQKSRRNTRGKDFRNTLKKNKTQQFRCLQSPPCRDIKAREGAGLPGGRSGRGCWDWWTRRFCWIQELNPTSWCLSENNCWSCCHFSIFCPDANTCKAALMLALWAVLGCMLDSPCNPSNITLNLCYLPKLSRSGWLWCHAWLYPITTLAPAKAWSQALLCSAISLT